MAGRWSLRVATVVALAFLYIPIAIIFLYSFNAERGQSWPIRTFTTQYYGLAWENGSVRDALALSLEAAVGATIVALILGTLAALAVHRFRFFGREAVSFALVLPLALPGIITGISLGTTINTLGIPFSPVTIVIGHATFCVVVVYNNVLARLRRSSRSLEEASMDLGADGFQTFRYVTLPVLATALLAGGMLAFALSFDEIIVTNFTAGTDQTLPIWIFSNIKLDRQRPIVNVVAVVLIVLSAVPVYLAQRLAGAGAARTR
ncbi:MAG: putative spermidine/putrescine transport system permease protein [Chloroflexota bacterium]|jgi:putative spermidine/putrescine transport system permease protein|nr:putative spermidine/putrescine transport system permease protein [Chloroflexota bacterium]